MRGLKIFSCVAMIFFAMNLLGGKSAEAGAASGVGRVVVRGAGKLVVKASTMIIRGAANLVIKTAEKIIISAGEFVIKSSIKAAVLIEKEVEDAALDKILETATADIKIPDDFKENANRAMAFIKAKIPDKIFDEQSDVEARGEKISDKLSRVNDTTIFKKNILENKILR